MAGIPFFQLLDTSLQGVQLREEMLLFRSLFCHVVKPLMEGYRCEDADYEQRSVPT
jgi:hypothetical protein